MEPTPTPQRDTAKGFMHTGIGILTIVLACVIVLPMLCCGGLFFLGVIGSAASSVP